MTESPFFEEFPVVISVSRLAQPLAEAPGAVTVIDRELIRLSGARTLAEVLLLVPGFQVAANEYGAPVATYHGPAEEFPQGLQVLIDGRSQYSPVTLGGVNWSALPIILDDIERIEVTRGSNSASYGANAFLGIVNIMTRPAAQDRGMAVEVRRGQGGIRDESLRVGGSSGPLNYRLSYNAQGDDGLPFSFDTLRQRQLHFRGDLRLGDRDELTLLTGALRGKLAIDGTDPIIDPPRFPRPLDQEYAQIGWRRVLSPSQDLALRYYRVHEHGGERFDIDIDRFVERELGIPVPGLGIGLAPIDNRYDSRRDDFELEHTLRPDDALRIVWGLGYRRDRLDFAQNFFAQGQQIQIVRRIFGNAEYRLNERWLANLGATAESDSNSGRSFSPRGTLHYRLTPGQTLRFGVAVAHRTPSLYEQRGREFYQAYGGTALDWVYAATRKLEAEKMLSREIGYVAEFAPYRLTIDARLSREQVTRGIVRINTLAFPEFATALEGSVDTSVNGLESIVDGFEYQVRWRPTDSTRLLFNQAFLNVKAKLNDEAAAALNGTDIQRQTLAGAPNHSATLMWMQELPWGFNFSATYRAVGKMQWTNGFGFRVSRYSATDWRLARSFRFEQTRGEVAFTVRDDGHAHEEFRRSEFVMPRGFISLRLEL